MISLNKMRQLPYLIHALTLYPPIKQYVLIPQLLTNRYIVIVKLAHHRAIVFPTICVIFCPKKEKLLKK